MIERDDKKKCYRVTVEKNGIKYFAELQPNPVELDYDLLTAKTADGKIITDERKHSLFIGAKRLLLEAMKDSFECKRKFELKERVVIAYYLAAAKALKEGTDVSVNRAGLDFVQTCAKQLSGQIGIQHAEAKATGQKAAYDFPNMKKNCIAEHRRTSSCTNKERNFYSSVLSTAFGWRTDKVPPKDLRLAKSIMPAGIINM